MSSVKKPNSLEVSAETSDSFVGNLKLLKFAGGMLFCLGLVAFAAFFFKDVLSEKISMSLSAAVLIAFGYPLLLYVQSLKKIDHLNNRIAALERKSNVTKEIE